MAYLSPLPPLPFPFPHYRSEGEGEGEPPLIEIATYSTAEKGERTPYSLSRLRETGGTTTPFLENWGVQTDGTHVIARSVPDIAYHARRTDIRSFHLLYKPEKRK